MAILAKWLRTKRLWVRVLLQPPAIEMFRVNKGIAPDIFANIFNTRNNMTNFTMPLMNSVYKKFETIFFLGSKLWDIIPLDRKGKKLETFKYTLKN